MDGARGNGERGLLRAAQGQGAEEYVPFVVLPAPGREARIAFLLPTVEYMAYANEHMAFDGALGELLTGQLPTLNP